MNTCTYIGEKKIGTCSLTSIGTRTVCTNARKCYKEVDRGRPSGHSCQGLGAIRAVCRAWRALKVFFSAGMEKTISRLSF